MFGKRCKLCGGKVSGGICEECGLDQRKTHRNTTKNYTTGGNYTSQHSNPAQTSHMTTSSYNTHNGDTTKKNYATKNTKTTREYTTTSGNGRKFKLFKWVVIILFGSNILGGLFGFITSSFEHLGNQEVWSPQEEFVGSQEEIEDNCSYLFHDFQTAEITSEYATDNIILPTSGEAFSISLESGFYEVGVDLPTGIYKVEGLLESRIEIFNQKYTKHSYDSIYDTYIMDSGKSYPIEVYLMEGTVFYISEGEFQFTSELADVASMTSIEEGETVDKYYVTETELIGTHIPEGFYNISVPNNHRSRAEITYPDNEEADYINISLNAYEELSEYDTRKEVIYNVPLWEGITLELQEDDIIILTPTTRSTENIKEKYEDFIIRSW